MEETAIFGSILGNSVAALGTWSYGEMAVVTLVASLILGLCYKLKLNGTLETMFEGAKKLIVPALLVILAYTVVYFGGNTMFFTTVENAILGLLSKYKIATVLTSTVSIALGSLLNVDMELQC